MTFRTEAQARAFLAQVSADGLAVVSTTHGCWTIVGRGKHKAATEICSICGESFPEYSCNAYPVNDGRCCAYCDDHVVTPARIRAMGGNA